MKLKDAYEVVLPAREILRQVTIRVRVTGLPAMRARVWLGTRLFRLAAAVMGCAVEIDVPKVAAIADV